MTMLEHQPTFDLRMLLSVALAITGCDATSPTTADAGTTLADASASADATTTTADAGTARDATPTDTGATESSALTPQDLTILYPYPSAAELPGLLTAASEGLGGALIPDEVFGLLPTVVTHPRERANSRAATRVVGVRANCVFDPETPEDPCVGQLQLVFQVMDLGAGGASVEVFDASIHGVYPLDDATFMALVRDLRDLRVAHGEFEEEALSVHPLLASQGIGGAFGTELAALVLRYAGARTLHKVTFITIDEPTPNARGGEVWTFGAVVEHDGHFEALQIPELGTATKQRLVAVGQAQSLPASSFDVIIEPELPASTDLAGLFGSGSLSSTPAAEAAYEQALELENPRLRSANDVDCVSCHITHARRRGELLLGLSAEGRPNRSAYEGTTGVATVKSAVGVRAMGWSVFAPKPDDARPEERASRAISQRLINETAYSVEYLRTQLD